MTMVFMPRMSLWFFSDFFSQNHLGLPYGFHCFKHVKCFHPRVSCWLFHLCLMISEFLMGTLSSLEEGKRAFFPRQSTVTHLGHLSPHKKGGVVSLGPSGAGLVRPPECPDILNGHQEPGTIPGKPLCQSSTAHDLSEWAPSGELKVSLRILQHILALCDLKKSFNYFFC